MYNYPIMSWADFTTLLLTKFDLDPIYAMLTDAVADEAIDSPTLKRWLLAYWCYYSAGTASFIAEQPSHQFYEAMRAGFSGEGQYPRGHERRHFRGKDGMKAIDHLESFGPAENVVDFIYLYGDGGEYQAVANRAMQFTLFGPWIAWKICDMGERVLCLDIDFYGTSLYMYKDPVQGGALYRFGDWQHPITETELAEVVAAMEGEFVHYLAPPYLDRPLNVQEYETIFCKYKAHIKGHYPPLFDIMEIRHGLKEWGGLAGVLMNYLPDGVTDYQEAGPVIPSPINVLAINSLELEVIA